MSKSDRIFRAEARVQYDRVGALEGVDRHPALAAFAQQSLAGIKAREVVQQPGANGGLWIETELGGHEAGKHRHLFAVLQNVLPIRGAVLQPTEQPEDVGVEVGLAELDGRRLAVRRPPPLAPRSPLDWEGAHWYVLFNAHGGRHE